MQAASLFLFLCADSEEGNDVLGLVAVEDGDFQNLKHSALYLANDVVFHGGETCGLNLEHGHGEILVAKLDGLCGLEELKILTGEGVELLLTVAQKLLGGYVGDGVAGRQVRAGGVRFLLLESDQLPSRLQLKTYSNLRQEDTHSLQTYHFLPSHCSTYRKKQYVLQLP